MNPEGENRNKASVAFARAVSSYSFSVSQMFTQTLEAKKGLLWWFEYPSTALSSARPRPPSIVSRSMLTDTVSACLFLLRLVTQRDTHPKRTARSRGPPVPS